MLNLQQQGLRIIDVALDLLEETNRFFAINDSVIIAQGDIHDRTDDDLTISNDRALLNIVHAEDTALWRIEQRC